MIPDDDSPLVAAVQSGDSTPYGTLIERHLDALHAFVSLKLPVPHLVSEIAHETFVFAFHHINEFTAGTSFRAWLRAIAANKIRAELTRHAREENNRLHYAERQALEEALADANPSDFKELEALETCLGRLPEHLRHLLSLRYQNDHSSEQIARRLTRSLAWVRTTLCRVRQQLRECIERQLKGQAP